MTRSWVFTLPAANGWYSLWDDLIAKLPGFDPTFSNFPFVPSMVCELQSQSPSPANAGLTINVSYSREKAGGTDIFAGSADLRRTTGNQINVKSVFYKADGAGALVNVTLTA